MSKREWTTDVHKFEWDKILHYVILALSLEKDEEEAAASHYTFTDDT